MENLKWKDIRSEDLSKQLADFADANGLQALAACIIKAIQAYGGSQTAMGLYADVRDFGREMSSRAYNDAFPGTNCDEGTVKGGV